MIAATTPRADVADRLAGRMLDLAEQIARLQPEHIEPSERRALVTELRRLAERLEGVAHV